ICKQMACKVVRRSLCGIALCILTFISTYGIIKEDIFDWKSEQEELYEKEMAFRRGSSRT
ncbi:hypothetical protein, partial [Ruminococcus callidus]|uniref:hypothetical protein n=1 Tax=Ruminococcus callidus TaxID=40519 RepID=UPI00399BCFD5